MRTPTQGPMIDFAVETPLRQTMEYITAFGVPSLLIGVARLIWNGSKLQTTVENQGDQIKEVKVDIKGIRSDFTQHLQATRDYVSVPQLYRK